MAGNTFASEDEMRGPYQRALGRRAAAVVVSRVILRVVQWREHRSRERAERAGDPGLESDLKIEARQTIALVVIVVALEAVLPIAALSISL